MKLRPILLLILFAAAGLTACERDEIRAYQAPKDEPSPLAKDTPGGNTNAGDNHEHTEPPKWTKPESWTEQPASGMRAGSFLSAAKDGERADISVITFSGPAGGMLANVNRWRGQIALPETDEAGLKSMLQPINVAGEQGVLLDMAGEQPPAGKTKPQRTIAAILEHAGSSWFFKMTGEDSVVAAEKAAFIAFLQSVQFH
ncbi:MAG TPA: hypothetical protein VF614_16800 [Chthoniobacteraceae bacterium]